MAFLEQRTPTFIFTISPLLNVMLASVHTINDELSARNQSAPNKNLNEDSSPDFIEKMKAKGTQVKDEIVHQFNKTAHTLHNVQHQIQEKVETQADKIKEKGLNIFKGLKDKIMPPKNSSQHENEDQDSQEGVEMEYSELEKNAENITALTPPQFFLDEGFKGFLFTPSASMLNAKSKCVDLPSPFSGEISSLKTGGHCLTVCPKKNCKASWGIGNLRSVCKQYVSKVEKLEEFGFDNKIKSFKLC